MLSNLLKGDEILLRCFHQHALNMHWINILAINVFYRYENEDAIN